MGMIVPVSIISIALASASIGMFVLARSTQSARHQAFFVFALGSSLWVGGFGFLLLTQETAFIAILNAGGLILMLGAFLLAQAFIGVQFERTSIIWYLPFAVGFAIAIYPGLLILNVAFVKGAAVPTQGPVFPFYTLAFVVYGILIATLFVRAYRASPAREREQLRYFFLGISLFLFIAIVCDVVLPAFGEFRLNAIGPAASLIPVITTGFAIIRYQLLSIRLVIARAVVVSTGSGIAVCVYAALLTLAHTFISARLPGIEALSVLVAILTGIAGAQLLRTLLQRWFAEAPAASPRNASELDELAHALQSPLTVLKSGIQTLTLISPHEYHGRYANLEQCIDGMTRLVQTQLDEARGTHRCPEHVDTAALVRSIVEHARVVAEAEGIRVVTRIPQQPVLVRGSRQQLHTAFENILSNAVRYTRGCPDRRISISLTSSQERVRFTVADTGIGIAQSDLPHIFDRFYRGAGAITRTGHGLGLSLVKRAVEMHGGTVRVTSVPGKGSTFTVCLPR